MMRIEMKRILGAIGFGIMFFAIVTGAISALLGGMIYIAETFGVFYGLMFGVFVVLALIATGHYLEQGYGKSE
jgi:uncharacterized membrane protein